MKKLKSEKPLLVKVGKHYINPSDVAAIREVKVNVKAVVVNPSRFREDDDDDYEPEHTTRKKTMYVVDMKSNPNPTYAIWVDADDIELLLEQFNIQE